VTVADRCSIHITNLTTRERETALDALGAVILAVRFNTKKQMIIKNEQHTDRKPSFNYKSVNHLNVSRNEKPRYRRNWVHGHWASSMFDRELGLCLAPNICRQDCGGTFNVDNFVKMFAMLL